MTLYVDSAFDLEQLIVTWEQLNKNPHDHIAMYGGRSQGKTHLINQIKKTKKREINPKREKFSDYLFMNIYKGKDSAEAKKLKAAKQHKKHLATCAKNKKNRKRKNR